jgi:hypothetical protein
MASKRNIVFLPATDAYERESLAAEAKLAEERKARKQGKALAKERDERRVD